MRVGIDVRALATASGRRGVGSYIRGLIGGLAEASDAGDEFVLLAHRDDPAFPIPPRMVRVDLARPRRAITVFDQFAWPPFLRRARLDVFHSPFYASPLLHPKSCSIVQTIFDLTPLRQAHSVNRRNRMLFRLNFGLARAADCILAPSVSTRQDVARILRIPERKIVFIPLAADFGDEEIEAARRDVPAVLHRHGIVGRYLLHTGGQDYAKNLPALIGAVAALVSRGHDLRLVIAGEQSAVTSSLIEHARKLSVNDRVIFPGYVSRPELIALYCGAAALAYPSLLEGFGLPILEAMACGTPVVAAACGSIPEVGGDACLYVDHRDVDAIAGTIARVLEEPALAIDLAQRGRLRAAEFSWRATARETLRVYRQLAG